MTKGGSDAIFFIKKMDIRDIKKDVVYMFFLKENVEENK